MTERLLVVDASLSKRPATELENRGKPSRSVGRVANRHLKDPELLPTLVNRLGDEPWVLVTGDDNMPGEHGALVTELRLTIATVDPRWYGSGFVGRARDDGHRLVGRPRLSATPAAPREVLARRSRPGCARWRRDRTAAAPSIPAAVNGVVGLKPARDRISLGPLLGEMSFGLSTSGALTRTVADAALALDVMAGPTPGDPGMAPPPARPFLDEVDREPGPARIGITRQAPFTPDGLHPSVAAALEWHARVPPATV